MVTNIEIIILCQGIPVLQGSAEQSRITRNLMFEVQFRSGIPERSWRGWIASLIWWIGFPVYSPDNRIIFATGPVSGSRIWGSCRYGVFTKSPQTMLYSESYSGGKAPEAGVNDTVFAHIAAISSTTSIS